MPAHGNLACLSAISNRVIISYPLISTHSICAINGILTYIIGHNIYHGHYLNAGGLSVNNYVRENKVREVNVRENKIRKNTGQFECGFSSHQ